MAKRLRMLDNESGLVEITTRTQHGRFLCRPSAESNDLVLGVLGRALADSGDVDSTVSGDVRYYDQDGQPTAVGTAMFEVRWLPAAGMRDQFAVIGEARFTTFRSRERRIVIHTLSIDRGSTNNAFN